MDMVKWEQIAEANKTIGTMPFERFNRKTGKYDVKDYAEVNQRVKAFRMCFPTGKIETEILALDDKVVRMRATAGFYADDGHFVLLATGTAFEVKAASNINQTSYIENCETSAVGRCLGFCGFGIETSICSAEEMTNALAQQTARDPEPVQNAPIPRYPAPAKPAQPKAEAKPAEADGAESAEEMAYRALCLTKFPEAAMDESCVRHFGTPFSGTPVAKIMEMLPADKLNMIPDREV